MAPDILDVMVRCVLSDGVPGKHRGLNCQPSHSAPTELMDGRYVFPAGISDSVTGLILPHELDPFLRSPNHTPVPHVAEHG